MSKSINGNTDNFADYQAFFDYFARSLEDVTKKVEVYSKSMDSLLKSTLEREVTIRNTSRMTATEITRSVSNMQRTLKEMGIELGKEGKAFVKHLRDTAVTQSRKPAGLSADKFKNDFINIGLTELITRAAKSGDNSFIKGFSKSDFAKNIADEINKRLGLAGIADSTIYKLTNFMRAQDKEKEKKTKGFIDDLVDGLAKSKFIGGALRDTVRLFGLLGANWLSRHFGALGKVLGTALYVMTDTLSGVLTQGIISGIVSGITQALTMTFGGKIASSLFSLFKKGGVAGKAASTVPLIGKQFKTDGAYLSYKSTIESGGTHDYAMKVARAREASDLRKLGGLGTQTAKGISTGAKLAKFGVGAAKGIGGLLAGFALESGANWAVGKGVNASLAHGISGAGQGAIAGAMLGSFIPVIGNVTGAVIGGAIGGIAGIIKGFREDAKDHYKTVEDESKEQKGFWQNFVNWLRESKLGQMLGWSEESSDKDSQKAGVPVSRKDARTNIQEATTFDKLKLGKDKAILNLSDLSQAEASKQLQAYEKADPTSFNKIYEWAGSDVARLSSFQTDAARLNASGNVTGALMYKGASEDLKALRSKVYNSLIDKGYSNEQADYLSKNLMYTSGRMTGSNTQHKGKGKWKSHDNIYGFGFDIGGGVVWSEKDYKAAEGAVKEFYKDKGFQVAYESAGQGKSTGKHWDIKPVKNMQAKGAQEILEEVNKEQKATSEQHSLEAALILKELDEKKQKDLMQKHSGKSVEEMGEVYEKELKSRGITSEGGKWMQSTGTASHEVNVSWDPSGNATIDNLTFMSNYSNMGANQ